MSQKSSFQQSARFVSEALTPDSVARQSWCAGVAPSTLHWIAHTRARLKVIKAPRQPYDRDREFGWPSQSKPFDRRQIVRLLAQGLRLSLDDARHRDDIDECFARAWHIFVDVCEQAEGGYRLDFRKSSLSPVLHAYACPVVAGIVRDRLFRGLSPNPPAPTADFLPARGVNFPRLCFPYGDDAGVAMEAKRVIEWLRNDKDILNLRNLGIWSDMHDRIAQYSVYYRAAEHSAQQPGKRLKEYEKEFKAGRINVLSCSTTMEMGVDIGSVSTVAMTNVPPSIASYRQRVGRAGRRGQAVATSLTLCKDRPIDRSVFRNPRAFLERTIYAPSVALDSVVITQRHVNSALLARFLAEQRAELQKITVGPFFGFKADASTMEPGDSLAEKFAIWLDSNALRDDRESRKELEQLLIGTPLEGSVPLAIDQTRDAISSAREDFANEWEAVRYDLNSTKEAGGKKSALEMQLRRLVHEFLLSDLAGRGFLPGYGFPTDVVNFDNILFVGGAQGSGQTGDSGFASDSPNSRLRLRDTPSRQLDLAIRDYAPGNDVVVDGRVYRSAGLHLAWKRPVTEESAENIHALGTAWRCKACGANGAGHAKPNLCSSCGSVNLTTHRYLKPSGFSCDPWVKPHDKIEEMNFIKPKNPWVAAQGGEWINLTAREAGRFRASRTGSVFFYTLGSGGYGYAICLSCGRSEPETGPEHEGPPLPVDMATHRPLRSKKRNDLHCEGVEDDRRPFVIQRHRAMGYQVTTDVFELQLHDLPSASEGLPLAVALRDALARKLGVEDTEMGVSVTQTTGDDGIGRWSILLFDTAPGGAGFSISAAMHIEDLLKDAARILDCPNGDACVFGCPDCIMCRDIENNEAMIKRKEAFQFTRTLVDGLGLPPELAVMGPDTRAESQPLVDAIMREMEARPCAELLVWLTGSPDDWDLARWPALKAARRLSARGRSVRIVADPKALDATDHAIRLELYGLALKAGCELEVAHPISVSGSHNMLAWVGVSGNGVGWVSADALASTASEAWGGLGQHAVLRGPAKCSVAGTRVDPANFLRDRERTAVIDIGNQLDGWIDQFGTAFWDFMAQHSAVIRDRRQRRAPLRDVAYSDRYLNSPLPVRLMREVFLTAPGMDGSTKVHLTTARLAPSAASFSPIQIKHDWRLTNHRDAVLQGVLSSDFPQRSQLLLRDKRDVAHGRVLRLSYDDGDVALYLDQGLGYWTTAVSMPFSFSAAIADQVNELRRTRYRVRQLGVYPSWVALKEEK